MAMDQDLELMPRVREGDAESFEQLLRRRNLERWNSPTPRQKEQIRERQEIL